MDTRFCEGQRGLNINSFTAEIYVVGLTINHSKWNSNLTSNFKNELLPVFFDLWDWFTEVEDDDVEEEDEDGYGGKLRPRTKLKKHGKITLS